MTQQPKSPLDSWLEKHGINLDWEAKAALREAVHAMVTAEPERMTLEVCSNCMTKVNIYTGLPRVILPRMR